MLPNFVYLYKWYFFSHIIWFLKQLCYSSGNFACHSFWDCQSLSEKHIGTHNRIQCIEVLIIFNSYRYMKSVQQCKQSMLREPMNAMFLVLRIPDHSLKHVFSCLSINHPTYVFILHNSIAELHTLLDSMTHPFNRCQ